MFLLSKLNRYAQKRRHKRELEKRYANGYSYYGHNRGSVNMLRDRLIREAEENSDSWWYKKHPPRNNGWEYWRIIYLSGRRGFAKKYSNKRIRQKYRQMICKDDPEEVIALRRAGYEKEFDYNWTVW